MLTDMYIIRRTCVLTNVFWYICVKTLNMCVLIDIYGGWFISMCSSMYVLTVIDVC